MRPMHRTRTAVAILAISVLLQIGCATSMPAIDLPPNAELQRIADLKRDILALDSRIDSEEAQRAAHIAIQYSQELARQYQVTGSAIAHNLKVNLGLRSRGLCIHWTEDLLRRLQQERFQSLDLHWAIANYEAAFRLEHSSVILSANHDSLDHGLVLDPWRNSGYLFWAPTLEDSDYPWEPRGEVMALKRVHQAAIENRQFNR